ncbi:MAG: NAD(P)/FAD-dependent oxidoreductase [Acidobacteriota bacterium]|nr:NAD(P)/FAD-dependent oxidoreductase [Acidobacteriota bacterium]MDH3531217.1 NAD(P)/FAD-dependent oxidoreductase [Acidobacteriota bacterium]
MKSKSLKTQVLVIGAGVAGASLAVRLTKQGFDVLVVEKDIFPRHKLCGEFVSPECLAHFEQIGVLDSMREIGGDVIRETRFISESGRTLRVPSEWFSNGTSGALGISRAEMDYRLLRKAREEGAWVIEGQRVVSISTAKNRVQGVVVKDKSGERTGIEADLIVDATGRARVAGKLVERGTGSNKGGRSTKHIAFKAHFENVRLERGVCEIYFFRGGYGGLNYVEDGLANHCFIIETQTARQYGGDADRIVSEVIFRNKKVRKALEGARRRFDWIAVSVEKFGRQASVDPENLISIGDARAFIDPFTGSGMLMALESSELLANAIGRKDIKDAGMIKERFDADHRRAIRQRLNVCSIIRGLAFSPRLAGFVIGAGSLSGSLLERITALTRPARNISE